MKGIGMRRQDGYEIKNVTAVYLDRANSEIIVCGIPDDGNGHNCDDIGCSSVEHILFRCWARDKRFGFNM